MNVLCNNCNLNCSIEQCREHLSNVIAEKEYNLLEKEVITLSQSLDDLIDKCISCEKNLVMD